MLIAEELLLMALGGRLRRRLRVANDRLEVALGGALIAELALMEESR